MSSNPASSCANVHKDFHGALSYGLDFIEKSYGFDGLCSFLSVMAPAVYQPLIEDLRVRGLVALAEHWQKVFALEAGDYELQADEDVLTLTVRRCPAIDHMQEHGYAIAEHFCEHTRVVNEAVCRAAGYRAEVVYDQAAGSCVQRFWKDAS